MKSANITNHSELLFRIMELKAQKLSQEIQLKNSIKEFVYTLNPVSMVKDSLHELAKDKEVRFDLAKVGLNMGTNFILDKLLGRNKSIKGFLSSVLVEKLSATFINKNASSIISGLGKLIRSKPEHENE